MKSLTVTLSGQTGELRAAPRYRKQLFKLKATIWRGDHGIDAEGIPRSFAKYSLN